MPDVSETLTPNSSQLDNIDLRDGPPRIFTVTAVDVRPGTDQPVSVHLAEFDRPWKPGKNMRRVLAFCWGRESDNWVGKRVELFADERVKFGTETPGGTRISRMSHIDGKKSAPVLLSQGRPGTYKVDPLPDAPTAGPTTPGLLDTKSELAATMYAAITASDIPKDEVIAWVGNVIGRDIASTKEMTEDEARLVLDHLAAPAAEPEGAGRG